MTTNYKPTRFFVSYLSVLLLGIKRRYPKIHKKLLGITNMWSWFDDHMYIAHILGDLQDNTQESASAYGENYYNLAINIKHKLERKA